MKHIGLALAVAGGCGLIFGLREGSLIFINQEIYVSSARDCLTFIGLCLAVYVPLAIVLYLPIGIATGLLRGRFKPLSNPAETIPIYVALFCAMIGFLLLGWMKMEWVSPETLSNPAALVVDTLLSAAVGFMSWIAIRYPLKARRDWRPAARRSLGVMVAFLVLISIPLLELQSLKISRSSRPVGHRFSEKPLDVIWISLCTVRADHLSAYGYHRETTPILSRLAAEGILFENAVSPSCWTRPSHASLFTGTFLSRHGVDHEGLRIPKTIQTFTEVLRDAGYQTIGISNNYNAGAHLGIDRGFDLFVEVWGPLHRKLLVSYWWNIIREKGWEIRVNMCSARETNQIVRTWFDRHFDPARPFFLFINYAEAHDPYLPSDDDAERFIPAGVELDEAKAFCRAAFIRHGKEVHSSVPLTPKGLAIMEAMYDAELRYQDKLLGDLLSDLEGRGLLDRTIIIIVGDHGEHFGENGLIGHENSLYEPLIRVPLVIRYPGLEKSGERRKQLVQTTDIMPTTLALLGLMDPELTGQMQGIDLLAAGMNGSGPSHPMAISEFDISTEHPMRMIRKGHWKLITTAGESGELFDIARDPGELENMINRETFRADSLKGALREWTRSSATLVYDQEKANLDPDALRMLKSLGYINTE